MRHSRKTTVVAVMSFALVAAACGSSGGGDSKADSGATTTAAASSSSAAEAPTTAAAAGGSSSSAAATTAAPAKSKFGKVDDKTYAGAGDFKLDLSKCPSDWDINQGITANEIKLFTSQPTSGPLAGFGLIADGMRSYFKMAGPVDGRTVTLENKDDVYQADKTKANVDEAIAGKKYAALTVVIGTPNNLAIWDTTGQECMPQLLNGTGAAQWGDVENHPWTTGMQLDYSTEAFLWVEWIKKEFPNGAKIASVTFNNDFGKSYAKGVKVAIKGTNIELVTDELHEATAPNLTNQFTNIEAKNPDVILIQTSGAFCVQAMAEIEKRALKSKVMISGTCGSISQFFKPLIDQGLTGKDTHILQYIKDVNDPEFANDEWVKKFHTTLQAQGLDDKQSTYATGWVFGWFQHEMLKKAATYEGGLNRANIMLAARDLNETMPLMLPGVTNKMEGMKDAYLNEAARVAKYTITDPKATGTFVPQGEVINKEGSLGTYTKFQAAAGI